MALESYPARTPLLSILAARSGLVVTLTLPERIDAGHVRFARDLAPSAARYATEVERSFRGLVQHAVAADHPVGIVEEHRAGVAAEEPHPFAQDHWGDVHRDLVDQPRRVRLTAEIAGGHANETVAREVRGERDARLDEVAGGVKRCVLVVGEPLLRQGPVGNDDQLVPAAGLPSQPLVVSNRCRPITVTLTASQQG